MVYRNYISWPAMALTCWLSFSSVSGQERSGSQLGRVKIANGPHGKTVVTAEGKLFRGTSLMIFSYGSSIGKSDHIYDEAFWQSLVDNGVNAVRLACFDPWQRSHGAPGTSKPYPYTDFREAGQ